MMESPVRRRGYAPAPQPQQHIDNALQELVLTVLVWAGWLAFAAAMLVFLRFVL